MYPQNMTEAAKNEYVFHWKGLTSAIVANGIQKLREADIQWPPEPGEFATRFCKLQREDFGLPETAEAWREASTYAQQAGSHKWSHSAVQNAGRTIGWTTIAGYSHDDKIKRQFEYEYESRVNQYLAGKVPPDETAKALEDFSKESVFEASKRHSDQQQRQAIEAQGIDPEDGEAARKALARLIGKK